MTDKKAPVKIASIAELIAPPQPVELPNGEIATIRPLDAIGYELMVAIDEDPSANGHRIYELVGLCLPRVAEDTIKRLTPAECAVVTQMASGRIRDVQAIVEKMSGNAEAPVTTAEPEAQRSSTLSDSSAQASPQTSAVNSTT